MKDETQITISRLDYGALLIVCSSAAIHGGNFLALAFGPLEHLGLWAAFGVLAVMLASGVAAIFLFVLGFVRIYQWWRAWRAAP